MEHLIEKRPKELHEYEDSLKAYRDIKNSLDTAMEQGFEKGREEGREVGRAEGRAEGLSAGREEAKLESAKRFLSMGLPPQQIADGTGLPIETVLQLEKDCFKES